MFKKAPQYIMEKVEKENNILGEDLSLDIYYKGVKLTVKRHPETGHLNGYITLPSDINEKEYDSLERRAHRGITYDDYDYEGKRVLGFDCAHAWDMTPYAIIGSLDDQYRDLEYVLSILKDMAEYVKKDE
ncbi:hypothetical protein QCF18_09920 [Staphylococcus aureus]|jgi:hypothetical protein|uniref:ORF10 n=23 Tax=Kayvirus TaxID=1857843 RepID=Q6Y7V6_BPPGK|nr:hypothetical protein [Staphylococcus aureus]YP_009041260.1 hypothetical protein CPT_phageK_gp228 [Staphylococcus phage K]YP_009098174.1 transglycosylase [Staphylococcus phage Team1]YP_009224450.1 hypothetical protein ST812_040 [Staphylococcus phage 812]YP_009780234.1 hypothetical protein QLX23_gp209 [Staphylococcus phage ISP]YP_009780346.1 hypothetical protein QLX37_gp073 [Staphylococcus phage SA5]YP_009780959.1 hypothetical protein QLX31_gp041 [Staphylococcus phage 676Z]YP_009781192.1 hy